jgi:hypothetical protein
MLPKIRISFDEDYQGNKTAKVEATIGEVVVFSRVVTANELQKVLEVYVADEVKQAMKKLQKDLDRYLPEK